MSSIACVDLIKVFQGSNEDRKVAALRGVDLAIAGGTFSAIVGPSGSGKTTILNIIRGVLQPTSGEVYIDETRIDHLQGKELQQFVLEHIGYVPQFAEDVLFGDLTVEKNVYYSLMLAGVPRQEAKKRISLILEKLKLVETMKQKTRLLSGGEAQRAALAVALANAPSLIIADEPTGELDFDSTLQVVELLEEIRTDGTSTILTASHDPIFIQRTDAAFYMESGRVYGIRQLKREKKVVHREKILVNLVTNNTIQFSPEIQQKVPVGEWAVVRVLEDPQGLMVTFIDDPTEVTYEKKYHIDKAGALTLPKELFIKGGIYERCRILVESGNILLLPVNSK